MNKIVPSFKESLFDGNKDLLKDIAEVGIDSVLDDGTLKDIPIVGLLIGTKNVVQNLQDRNLLNQALQFIKEINSGHINNEKLEKYKQLISKNDKKAEKELGRVLLILNRTIDYKKSKILANFFRNYVNQIITWEDFGELSSVLERLFINDIEILEDIKNEKINNKNNIELYQVDRLNALGLVRKNTAVWEDAKNKKYLVLTPLGNKFIKCKDIRN